MKKFRNLVLSAALIFVCLITLASCISSATTSISIAKMPKTTFTVNEEISEDDVLVQLLVNENSKTQYVELSYPDANGNVKVSVAGYEGRIQIKGFNLSVAGNFTAVVLYGSASSYFDYEVIDAESGFSGGNGTVNNPYQITEADQLKLIASYPNANYKLMNDIDMMNITEEDTALGGLNNVQDVIVAGDFTGTFNGNGKKVFNIALGYKLFSNLVGSTIKNVDFYINSNFTIACLSEGEVLFENVNFYGTVKAEVNYGAYIVYPGLNEETNLILNNCYNELQIFGTQHNGGYISYVCNKTTSIEFNNCEFAGHIEGTKVSPFICNKQEGTKATVIFNNCEVTGSACGESVGLACSQNSEMTFINLPNASEAEIKVINKASFDDLAKFNDEGVLVLNAKNNDSNIVKVKVQVLTVAHYEDGSSLYLQIVEEFDLSAEALTTKFVNAEVVNETSNGADGKEAFYLGNGVYVFNGNNVHVNGEWNPVSCSACSLRVFCYDADGNLVAVTDSVKLPA